MAQRSSRHATPTTHGRIPRIDSTQCRLAVPAATNGVVLATEKKLTSILVEGDTMEKIAHYTGNVGSFIAVTARASCVRLQFTADST